MRKEQIVAEFKNRVHSVDWPLLVFLILFLNVKLVIKLAAILLIFLLRPGFKFGFRFRHSRLPLFYPFIVAIALFNWVATGLAGNLNYGVLLATGIFFWILCIGAAHQVKRSVEQNEPAVIHRTLLVFFILNALVSLAVYDGIVWETGAINPYQYQGDYQKYFIGTGDYIKGLSFDTSTTNAVINSFAVLYFLVRGKYGWTLFSMAILLLTGSNISNLVLSGTLLCLFLFRSTRNQKSMIVICLLSIVVFLVKVSPQNSSYISNAVEKFMNKKQESKPAGKEIPLTQRADSTLTEEEQKQKWAQQAIDSMYLAMVSRQQAAPVATKAIAVADTLKEKPVIPQPNIHTAPFQHREDTTRFQANLLEFITTDSLKQKTDSSFSSSKPGKLIALMQIADHFKQHPAQLITGAGMGMFSSKLAFRATALKIAGGYPQRFSFIGTDFKENHLALYLAYFTRSSRGHSIINTPNSTFGQLLSEYGLAGLGCFLVFYLGFFGKNYKQLTYGIPLLLLMTGFFFVDYWFEQLSVTVLFELLLFLDLKEHNPLTLNDPA